MSERALQIGDVCIVIASEVYPERIGSECTITDGLDHWKVFGEDTTVLSYRVESSSWGPSPAGSKKWLAQPHQLRRKRLDPPSSFDSADEDFTKDLLKQLGRVVAV